MPTQAEFASLYSACGGSDSSYTGTITTAISLTGTVQPKGVYWCTDADGVVGALFSDGTSQIFFPAAGTVFKNSFADGSEGAYWASTLTGNTSIAYRLLLRSANVYPASSNNRCYGRSIRPVCTAE